MSTAYQPLCEARDELRVSWYRCPIAPARLRALMQRSDAQGWFQAGGHLALFTATGVLAYLAWSQQIWILFALLLLAHGTVGSFLVGVAPHELGHGTVFRTKALNKLFLYLFSLLSWWDQFDTPLPAAARQVHSDSPDKLESSIGELAPNALA